MIEGYSFGRIVVRGKTFHQDLIIHPEGIEEGWWRKEGHRLSMEDLPAILSKEPEVLIIGTGASGLMKVPEEVREALKDRGIEVMVMETGRACSEYNRLLEEKKDRRVVAALHLTC